MLTFVWISWACGAMDNASDYGSEDSRFDSWQARIFYFALNLSLGIERCYANRQCVCASVRHEMYDVLRIKRLDLENPIFAHFMHVNDIKVRFRQIFIEIVDVLDLYFQDQRFGIEYIGKIIRDIISQTVTDMTNKATSNPEIICGLSIDIFKVDSGQF